LVVLCLAGYACAPKECILSIVGLIDDGVPVIVNLKGKGELLHYIFIVGYKLNLAGDRVTKFAIKDTCGANIDGKDVRLFAIHCKSNSFSVL